MLNLDKLAVIIPSWNRSDFLVRSIGYWCDRKIKIYVADGSDESISDSILRRYDSHLTYLHMKGANLSERLAAVSNVITEPYAAFIGDDEFFIPSALKSCIQFLDKNPDYSACIGECVSFYYFSGSLKWGLAYPKHHGYQLSFDDPLQRVVSHLRDYRQTHLYAVQRSAVLKSSLMAYSRGEYNIFAQAELQVEMTAAFAGKSVVIPEVMWLRSMNENQPIRGTEPSLDDRNDLLSFWETDSTNRENQISFVNNTADAFRSVQQTYKRDFVESVKFAIEAYNSYLRQIKNKKCFKSHFTLILERLKIIEFARWLKIFLSNFFNVSRKEMEIMQLHEFCRYLEHKKIKLSLVELADIENLIKEFHIGK